MSNDKGCSICSYEEYEHLFTAHDNLKISDRPFDLVRCKRCSVIRLLSPPDEEKMNEFYPNNYFTGTPDPFNPVNVRKKKILEKFTKSGKILDFGCGDFSFLLSLDEKWEKHGFDRKLYVDEKLFRDNNIKFWSDSLEQVDIKDNYLDVITFWASLEHTHNPGKLLVSSYKMLKKGGKIIILLQNIDSIQAKIFKEHWVHLDIPRHIYHFSLKTLEFTLKKLNFKILDVIHNNPDYNISGFSDSLRIYKSSKNMLKKNKQSNKLNEKDVNHKRVTISPNREDLGFTKKIKSLIIKYFFSCPLALVEIISGKGGIITVIAEK